MSRKESKEEKTDLNEEPDEEPEIDNLILNFPADYRITAPKSFRKKLGWKAGDNLVLMLHKKYLVVAKIDISPQIDEIKKDLKEL